MRTRPAFTLVELLLVLLVVGILFTMALSLTRTPTITLVEDQARRFALDVRAARADALAEAGIAWIEIDPGGGATGEDRYRVSLLEEGQEEGARVPGPWVPLTGGVRMSPGALGTGPLGDPAAPLTGPVTIRCMATGSCDLGGAVARTVYFSHPGDPRVVRAVTLGTHGGVRSWRWAPSEGSWQ